MVEGEGLRPNRPRASRPWGVPGRPIPGSTWLHPLDRPSWRPQGEAKPYYFGRPSQVGPRDLTIGHMTDSEPTIKPPRAQLTHVGLYVEDMEAMVAFYRELLGMVVTDHGELFGRELTFLSRNPGEHHQMVFVTGRRAPDDVQLLSQVSFRLDDDDLSSLRWFARRATELGATAMDMRNHGNSWSIYFLDPEANRLELYTTTPWYVSQPWREPLDLSETDEVIRSTTKSRIEKTATWSPIGEWTSALASRLAR